MQRLDITSADGTKLAGFRWTPQGEPRGDVVVCHGLGEHIGRYAQLVKALTDRGWRVTGADFRGHGHSEGKRGHVDGWFKYVEDLRAVVATIDGPVVLVAHSMGGLIALDYLRDSHDVVAAILSAPAVDESVEAPAWKVKAARLLSRLLPRLSMSSELPPEHVCSDPAVVEAYLADPLVFGTITPRWYSSMKKAQERVRAHTSSYRTPMFLFWGGGERIISQPELRAFESAYGGPITHRVWPDLFHETMNEKSGADVIAAALDWLDGLDAAGSAA